VLPINDDLDSINKLAQKIFDDVREIAFASRSMVEIACRKACQTSYIGNNTILCRVLTKYLCYLDARDVGIMPHLSMNGYWEFWITQAMIRSIDRGYHCIDVGANHGYYSLIMSDLIGSTGKLIAVEPTPKLAKLLEKTLDLNGFRDRTTVLQQAITDRTGETINLFIPDGYGMNATIFNESSSTGENIKVQTTTIDNLVRDWSKVDFIKIDAEGAEEVIWNGMQETISRHQGLKIMMEINCSRYQNPQKFLESIVNSGFMLKYIDFNSEVKNLTIDRCLNEQQGEDWMLFLSR
jgi:FkbM family methyltransferase